jgi:hypothetical protein
MISGFLERKQIMGLFLQDILFNWGLPGKGFGSQYRTKNLFIPAVYL